MQFMIGTIIFVAVIIGVFVFHGWYCRREEWINQIAMSEPCQWCGEPSKGNHHPLCPRDDEKSIAVFRRGWKDAHHGHPPREDGMIYTFGYQRGRSQRANEHAETAA